MFISKKKHDEEIEKITDTMNVQSSLADSEISFLKSSLQSLNGKYEEAQKSRKIFNDLSKNYRLVPIEEYKSLCTKLGGLTKGNHKLQNERDNLKTELRKFQTLSDVYVTQLKKVQKNHDDMVEENIELRKIISNLAKPKVSMGKLIEYEGMSKNGKGKLTGRTKEVPGQAQK